MRSRTVTGSVLLLAAATVGCTTAQRVIESAGEVAAARDGAALKTAMRELWADHVVWTRGYIVAAVANDASASAAAARLMKNQEDIGNAIKPYYGNDAGNRLTSLLKDHINIAVDVVTAAKAGDNVRVAAADRRWRTNADEIATFLAGANVNWSRTSLLAMLNEHLDLTTQEATARIQKRWTDDVSAFDRIFDQAMHMADELSAGIVKQFPEKF